MAGTIGLSLSQQFNSQGAPLAGGRLYFFQAGTTTPQSPYQDSGLAIPHANPIILDAAGRIPQFFLADGSIKVRLDSSIGVTQLAADGILVIGASSGGGGGSPVDATTVLQTGDLKVRYGTGVHSGWVRANGRTIGSATSGATERANADTEALFLYLWGADENLTVSTGRGASAAADWAANKTIALPDGRGRALASLADMGSSDNSMFSGATFTAGDSTTLGSTIGAARRTLIRSNLPNVTPTFTGQGTTAGLSQASILAGGTVAGVVTGGSGQGGVAIGQSFTNPTVTITPLGAVADINGGVAQTAFDAISPLLLITTYIKL
jgi:hypothetical protein